MQCFSSVCPMCVFTHRAVSQVLCSGSATLIGPPLPWEGFSPAVAMATRRVDDGLEVYSMFRRITPPSKICSVTLIMEILTENVMRLLSDKTHIKLGIMTANGCV